MTSRAQTPATSPVDAVQNRHKAAQNIERLLALMARLRDPEEGCPWDREQTHQTIAPYAIEEAYEVLDAIQRQDWQAFPDELGDLLLQVVYQAQLAEEEGKFAFADVAEIVTEKMIRRHPHVTFGKDVLGNAAQPQSVAAELSARAMPGQWEAIKEQERKRLAQSGGQAAQRPGALAGVPPVLPALLRASKLASRAARVGFDWPDISGVLDKVHEEINEFAVEMQKNDREKMQDELGDVLFSVASLARRLKLDPEACLRQACDKFTRRFEAVEARLAQDGLSMQNQSVEKLDAVWNAVKQTEKP
ncbi:MAG: nucleoside triphosphate pyrophosphohydrolase [Acetobacter fabarum]|uniref:nucleoside triphosphate pyrophosphohydrolase n=1 Tax=Acetobacter fabarum TaxID=483199 RepID=UPI00242DC2AD|nr:nucleoside triphosphate pyrophosphohydrolase [Acetobacter fabarum]MCH4025759.1 nucleoside triphosphate pyrophosphohydrolase [Acetobacter fabarum]MCH4054588.1 nucleoside triphosphate pyrophosphohydrolase [Acetobacter fabarum]MCH4086381.1 nucleoside triphosphate pyrophosphohydrolase [Acetobacter fabarum]MCH4128839.1 nucleoside triphosphate pyrophosphohydrolase [Acetobacter fabarum]MCH4138256.1 nucleoside triphosphate pyrophosphohydrolase [Acetobacter fabarum]